MTFSNMSNIQNTSAQQSDFNFNTDYTFNNELFNCHIFTVNQNSSLVIQVESQETFERWKGEFPSQSIEAVTQKTGNFKKFSVFVKMLYSSLTQKSETVSIDLLTRQQLEILFRKNKQTYQPKNTNQRYLILTYAVEFDRVHYPLPLTYEEPTIDRLKEIVKRLKQNPKNNDADVARLQQENISLREENEDLKVKIQEKNEQLKNISLGDVDQLRGQVEKLKKDKHQLRVLLERKKKESENEIQVMQRECDILAADLKHQSEEMEKMKQLVESGEIGQDSIYRKRIQKYKQELKHLEERKNEEIADLRKRLSHIDSRRTPNRISSRASSRNSSYMRQPSPAGSVQGSRPSSRSNSRAGSRSNSRPNSNSKSRPGSLNSSKRFDPTEYIRQQQEKRRNSTRKTPLSSRRSSVDSISNRPSERSRSRHSSNERNLSAGRILNGSRQRQSKSRSESQGISPRILNRKEKSGLPIDPQLLKENLRKLKQKKEQYGYSSDDYESNSEQPIRVIARKKSNQDSTSSDRRKIRTKLRKRYDLTYDTDDSDLFEDDR